METLIEPKDRCPHIIVIGSPENFRYYCDLTERPSGRIKPCLLMSGEECESWNEIQKEWAEEK